VLPKDAEHGLSNLRKWLSGGIVIEIDLVGDNGHHAFHCLLRRALAVFPPTKQDL
jgi:hypothetical protein